MSSPGPAQKLTDFFQFLIEIENIFYDFSEFLLEHLTFSKKIQNTEELFFLEHSINFLHFPLKNNQIPLKMAKLQIFETFRKSSFYKRYCNLVGFDVIAMKLIFLKSAESDGSNEYNHEYFLSKLRNDAI